MTEWNSDEIVQTLSDEVPTWPGVKYVSRDKVNSHQSVLNVVVNDGLRRFRITVDSLD